jgi:transcription antitermination factor NusG
MAWYALITVPGAQLPKREYKTEITKSRKGYRLDVATNHDLSAIERALEAHGFEYYMPTEKRLVRDRRHTDLWKIRRFALMVGYVFIRRPYSWDKLLGTLSTPGVPGVQGVVRSAEGQPLPIDITDILMMRAMEAEYDARFDIQSKNARAKLRKQARTDPRLKKLIGVLDTAGKFTVPVNSDIFEVAV